MIARATEASASWARPGAIGAVLGLLLLACGCGDGSTPPSTGAVGPRPSSSAVIAIVEPANGQTVGRSTRISVELSGAHLVDVTSTDVRPDEGHLHVTVDDQLVSMTGELQQTLSDLDPGLHTLKVEFVAADHAPFDPRVIEAVAFEVEDR